MRILILSASYAPVMGGLQAMTRMLAKRLVRRGHQVRVVANRYPRWLPPSELMDGIPVQRLLFLVPDLSLLRRGRIDLFLASLYYQPATMMRLRRLLNRFQPHVVNVHFPDAQVPFVLRLCRHARLRLIVSLHGNDIERWMAHQDFGAWDGEPGQEAWRLRGCRALLKQAHAVVACSRYLLDCAIRLEPQVYGKGLVIPNGFEAENFCDPCSMSWGRAYLLALGRMTPVKGFDMLLEAFGDVASDFPEVDLVLAGEGEQRAQLEQQATELGIRARVRFFGAATPEQAVRLMKGSLFVVVPSRREAFGMVALEAMAAGKAVLATRVGGLAELVEGPSGILVEPTSIALRNGLHSFLSHPSTLAQIGARNREMAARYEWGHVIEMYEELLSDAC